MLLAVSLYAADNDLYNNSISLNLGYGLTTAETTAYSGALYGFQFNCNLNTLDEAWRLDAWQLAVDYVKLNTTARDYTVRIGVNGLWYFENYTEWTPFVKMGAGLQITSGTEELPVGDYLIGTLGGGIEYQIRGDTSLIGEWTDHMTATGENSVRLAAGIKYSFGQSY